MNLIVFWGLSNCVNTQYAALSVAMGLSNQPLFNFYFIKFLVSMFIYIHIFSMPVTKALASLGICSN